MYLIEWNVGYNADPKKIVNELYSYLMDTCVIALLEVTQEKYKEYSELLEAEYDVFYSLEIRSPGKFDGKARRLGVVFIFSKDITVTTYGVCERTLLPERTLWADFEVDKRSYKVVAYHSVTGCDYKKAKSLNFNAFSEWIDENAPDIVMMDANEPESDHYEISKMKFFDNKGNGAEMLFNTLDQMNYKDCLSSVYDINNYIEGQPLAVSHIIKGCRKPKRYDFIFVNADVFAPVETEYMYDKAVEATADHAIVVSDVMPKEQ